MADLITLAEYKTYKGINSSQHDTRISDIITKVSALIKNYCNRTFVDYASIDKVEYFRYIPEDGNLLLSEFPLISVSYVLTSSDGGVTQTDMDEDDDYFVDTQEDMLVFPTVPSTEGFKAFEVKYKGGYTTLPEDLKLCTINMVDYFRDEEFTSKKQSMNTIIEYSSAKLPYHMKRTLDLYRVIL